MKLDSDALHEINKLFNKQLKDLLDADYLVDMIDMDHLVMITNKQNYIQEIIEKNSLIEVDSYDISKPGDMELEDSIFELYKVQVDFKRIRTHILLKDKYDSLGAKLPALCEEIESFINNNYKIEKVL